MQCKFLAAAVMGLGTVGCAALPLPIQYGVLTGNLNANGQAITNVARVIFADGTTLTTAANVALVTSLAGYAFSGAGSTIVNGDYYPAASGTYTNAACFFTTNGLPTAVVYGADGTMYYATTNGLAGTWGNLWYSGNNPVSTLGSGCAPTVTPIWVLSGVNGNGINGTNGLNGLNGTNGINGTNGLNGTPVAGFTGMVTNVMVLQLQTNMVTVTNIGYTVSGAGESAFNALYTSAGATVFAPSPDLNNVALGYSGTYWYFYNNAFSYEGGPEPAPGEYASAPAAPSSPAVTFYPTGGSGAAPTVVRVTWFTTNLITAVLETYDLTEYTNGVCQTNINDVCVTNVVLTQAVAVCGLNGTNGLNGINGTNGAQGIQGIQGVPGLNGTNGLNGINGTNGAQGIQGIQGVPGLNGTNGLNGINGTNGAQGIQGIQGVPGLNGTNGLNGINGTNGAQGIQGIQGIPGLNGTNGLNGINCTNGAGVIGWTTNTLIAVVITNAVYITNSASAGVGLLTNLTAYWKLDETSGTRADSSGNGYSLTDTNGNVTYGSGVIGNAANFTNNGPNGAGLQHVGSVAPTNMSVSMWVHDSPTGGSLRVYYQSATFSLYYGGASYGMTAAAYFSGTSPKVWQGTGWTNGPGGWTFFTAIYTGTNLALYVGGVLVSNSLAVGTLNNTWPNTFYIGSDGGGDSRTATGMIDEVGVWSRALTTNEISYLAATNPYSSFGAGGGGAVTTNYVYVTNYTAVLTTNSGVVNLQGGAFVANPLVTNGVTANGQVPISTNTATGGYVWGTPAAGGSGAGGLSTNGASANGQVPVINSAVAGGYAWAAQAAASGVTNGQANVGLTVQFLVTNTAIPGAFSSDNPPIFGLVGNYYANDTLWGLENQLITGGWVTYPNYYMGYTGTYPYPDGTVGEGGVQTYMYNFHALGVSTGNGVNGSGDNRIAVGVACMYGNYGDDGGQVEELCRKNTGALGGSGGWLYAEAIKYDGFSRVQLGFNPVAEHTLWYPGHAYVDIRTGGNTDVPALLLRDEALSAATVYGALEKSGGMLWWTDNNGNRAPLVNSNFSGAVILTNANNVFDGTHVGNAGALTNMVLNGPTNAIVPGNTTTPKAWANFTNSSGGVFKLPLYQ